MTLSVKCKKQRHYQLTISKKYLLYLVDYHIVSYNGQRHVYAIEHDGFDLLDMIMKEKRVMNANMDDLVITLE